MSGLYIHIPFCSSRCIYCDFYSTTGNEQLQERYINAVLEEYHLRNDFLHDNNIQTVYIGGGTPSTLSAECLHRLCTGLCLSPSEFTIECNPDDVSESLVSQLKELGINRVSMGVQTFSDKRLEFLNRRHKSCQVFAAVDMLRSAGINNISIDLMFGFPEESISEWGRDIITALSLDVEHLSAYSLMYEEGTMLYSMLKKGMIKENTEEVSAQMYDMLIEKLCSAGYEHYEISNFAKSGFRSVHNSNYWNGTEYIGLGAAAHSYNVTTRQWNISELKKYIECIEKGILPTEIEYLDADTRYNDMITTALRTKDGLDMEKLSPRHRKYINDNAQKSIAAGLLCIEGNQLHLTRQGLYVSDNVMSDLIMI